MRLVSRQHEDLDTELGEARNRIAGLEAALAQATTHDQLTDALLSLPAFRAQLDLDVERAHRYRRPLSVALIDVDGFRAINTERGFAAGDAVLLALGRLLVEGTRTTDLSCRVGGDEFALLLPELGSTAALRLAERLLVAMEELDAGAVRGLTASVGIAALGPGQDAETLLSSAGAALDEARSAGGGRAVVFAPGVGDGRSEGEEGERGDVIAALASALQERDRYTGDHSVSVVEVTVRVAEALALDRREVETVRMAALLHDVGKVGIPDEILHKRGPLDRDEWELMHKHPLIGERILRAIPGMGAVARMVRHEHERWDGRGYPDGLAGDEIPIGSRIILACDAYHAMTSDRPYRAAISHREAVSELTRNAGTQFDPAVAEALVGYLFGRRQSGETAL